MTFFLLLFHVKEITGHQTVGLAVMDSQFVSGHQNRLKWEKKPVSIFKRKYVDKGCRLRVALQEYLWINFLINFLGSSDDLKKNPNIGLDQL